MSQKERSCFTLIELLVLSTLILILASILMPVLRRTIDAAHMSSCKQNLKTMFNCVIFYSDDNDDFLPGPCSKYVKPKINLTLFKSDNSNGTSLFFSEYLKPYVEAVPISSEISFVPNFVCPANDEFDINKKLHNRIQYSLPKTSDELMSRPFGLHKGINEFGVFQNYIPSTTFYDIINPEKVIAIQDLRFKKKYMKTVHDNFLVNQLYFNGAVITDVLNL